MEEAGFTVIPDRCAADVNGWSEACETLRSMVSNDAFQRWFRAAEWMGHEDGVGSVAVPGEIHQVWIETNYLPELTMAVSQAFEDVREVKVIVGDTAPGTPSEDDGSAAPRTMSRPVVLDLRVR